MDRVKRGFEAFSRGDFETAFEFIDPSLEINDRVVPEANPSDRGPDALIANSGGAGDDRLRGGSGDDALLGDNGSIVHPRLQRRHFARRGRRGVRRQG